MELKEIPLTLCVKIAIVEDDPENVPFSGGAEELAEAKKEAPKVEAPAPTPTPAAVASPTSGGTNSNGPLRKKILYSIGQGHGQRAWS